MPQRLEYGDGTMHAHCKKLNHVRVHANLIEGCGELSLALPGDNPWRNDLRHLVHAGQEFLRMQTSNLEPRTPRSC
jgi:hypothetical protein